MTNAQFTQVIQRLDPHTKLLRAWPLKGGVSAQVTALEIQRPGGHTQKLIVRQHGEADRQRNPQIAADEFKLLQLLHAEGLRTPVPCAFDQSGEILATPYVVIAYIEGKPEFAPTDLPGFIRQFATHLARIHRTDCAALAFLPTSTSPFPQRNASGLLHGDFWPGNLLWQDGRLVAVIDWEDAALGDPLADVANSRLEILWAFGSDAMQQFTDQYRAVATIDFTNLPCWDLCAAALKPAVRIAEWSLDATTERRMREEHRWFVNQAFAQL